MKTIVKLARQAGKELAGTAVYSLFIGRRIQSLQHRSLRWSEGFDEVLKGRAFIEGSY